MMKFSKMHALGNDFVLLDSITQDLNGFEFTEDIVRKLSDRHRGIGFDQLLIVERPRDGQMADFGYRIFNADGGEVYQCGNGARCFAKFVSIHNLSKKNPLRVETRAGILQLHRKDSENENCISVNIGAPEFRAAHIPILNNPLEMDEYDFELEDGKKVKFGAVAVGNPHAVIFVEDIDTIELEKIGKMFNTSKFVFPEGVNIEFVQIISKGHIRIRVYERGVGETSACGSGACASVVVCRRRGLVDKNEVQVDMRGGRLKVIWSGEGDVLLEGPAEHVFDGYIHMKDFLKYGKLSKEVD